MKLLQHGFYLLFLANTVGLLLAVITALHLPVMAVWVTLALTAAIVCAAGSLERHNNQKEDQK
nr:MAG TPA: hypothetical protein [Caudoviricetes sp.]